MDLTEEQRKSIEPFFPPEELQRTAKKAAAWTASGERAECQLVIDTFVTVRAARLAEHSGMRILRVHEEERKRPAWTS